MSKNQFTGTATQPQRNATAHFCQFNKDQYCTTCDASHVYVVSTLTQSTKQAKQATPIAQKKVALYMFINIRYMIHYAFKLV